jgi:hypothetical protein
MAKWMLGSAVFLSLTIGTSAFMKHQQSLKVPQTLVFEGNGFGQAPGSSSAPSKTYGKEALAPIKDLIDTESAMREFFSSNEEWKPLFRSIVENSSVPAMNFIEDVDVSDFEFNEKTSPWRSLEAIPTKDEDRAVLADFLDNMQTSLIDIPVDESTEEDENDLHFIEEGRRMLACSRFHVIQGMEKGSIQSYDSLFSACWSEVMHLRRADEINTGSLIVVPECDIDDMRRFADMNLKRPLQWLGIDSGFEVASMKSGSPAIRLIHKLSDIPTDVGTEPEESTDVGTEPEE